jgi:hypothetical protein
VSWNLQYFFACFPAQGWSGTSHDMFVNWYFKQKRRHAHEYTMKSQIVGGIYALFTIAMAGCASAKVTQQAQRLPAHWTRPSQIVVFPFAVDPSEITLNQSVIQKTYRSASGDNESTAQVEISRATADSICQQIVSELNGSCYNSVCAKRGASIAGDNVLIVVDEFSNISEGNRLAVS